VLLLLTASLLSGCTLTTDPPTPATPDQRPGSSGAIQVFFTAPQYPDDKANHHGSVDDHLTDFINTASTSVDMAIYQLDLPNVTQALLNAARRGVTVRVATDQDETLEDPKENPALVQLQQAGIPVVGGNTDAIMHNKYAVVDRQRVWTGTWNFTDHDTYRYNNAGLWIESPELAANYTAAFETLFTDKQFGNKQKTRPTAAKLTIAGVPVENYFTPKDNAAGAIVNRLNQARQSIHFMAFSFTDDALGQAMLDKARNGVEVRGVFENTGSGTQFSEYGPLAEAGLDVLRDGNPYLMHHKVIIIDGRTVVVGSFNFSKSAQTSNDENLLIVDDASLARLFEEEFQRIYATAQNPPNR
jgi:phosphatidylserine/phosphatidylglycerophosphate/cardiolipin synthase-like enzyme